MVKSLFRPRLIVVGNGMASVRLCEELVARGAQNRFAITVISAEPVAGYNRVLLSAYLAGEASDDDIRLRDVAWYTAQGIDLRLGVRVTSIDRAVRQVILSDKTTLFYDRMILATGSQPITLPVPGADLKNVFTFRDLDDARALARLGPAPRRVAVIGGGLLGLECAYGLARAGHTVTVVHLMDRLMERQLDVRAASFLRRALIRKNIVIQLGKQTQSIRGDRHVTGIDFTDGSTLSADAVIFAAGIRPHVALAREAGLPVNRGIVVDDTMYADDGIFALGECAEHRGQVYGLVEPAYAQAQVLAQVLCGEASSYRGSTLATNLKVSGVNVFSVGDVEGADGTSSVIWEDLRRGDYRKLVFDGAHLAGAVMIGETADALWYRDLVMQRQDISALRSDLIFGKAACAPILAEAA